MKISHLIRLLAAATIYALAGRTPAVPAELPADVMPLSEVRPGMKGEAFSVVHGFKLERYEIEILGIEHGGLAGTGLILCRVAGPGLEQHGIVAGMSGSPVYIDGKIIGAMAYGFEFAYKPIAGITPIEAMLPVLDLLDEKPADGGEAAPAAAGPAAATPASGWDWEPEWQAYSGYQAPEDAVEAAEFRAQSPEAVAVLGSEPLRMVPLSTPFYVSGISPMSAGILKSFFTARGLQLMPAGSSAGSNETPSEPSPPMVAGSALAIPVVTGDLSIAATGTATYRQGNKILAFGHPAFSRGTIRAPLSQAYMIAYMQSYALGFKFGESREIVGSVLQDKQYGIGGVFGEAPPRIEIKVNMGGEASHPARTYNYSIWEDREFAPIFSMVTLSESVRAATAAAGELTGDCTYRIRLADGREIVKTQRASSREGLAESLSEPLLQDMFLLTKNPFGQADIESIEADVDVRPGYRHDQLLWARPRYERLTKDDPLVVQTRWRPYRGEDYDRTIELRLPADLKAGEYVLHLVDAGGARRIDQTHNRGRFRPRNLEEVIKLVGELSYPQTRLTAYVFEPQTGLSLQGRTIEGIPGSIERILAHSANEDLADEVIGRQVGSQPVEFEAPVGGRATFLIEVVPHLPR